MCVFIASLRTFFLPSKDFLSSAELLQESSGLLLFLTPHTLTEPPPPHFYSHLLNPFTNLWHIIIFLLHALCRKLYSPLNRL